MKISRKERLMTGTGIGALAVIAAAVAWTFGEVENANRQRRATSEIARGFVDLRLVTFDFRLYHTDRARVQWYAVSDRLDRLIENVTLPEPEEVQILGALRDRRAAGRRLFAELAADYERRDSEAPHDPTKGLFESQLLNQLLVYQQENFSDSLRLNNLVNETIVDAQRHAALAIIAGLLVLAAMTFGASWFIRKSMLRPIAVLQHATRQVAAGRWDFVLGIRSKDEIGDLSKNFDDMTKSLQHSFAQIEQSNRNLALLNEELEAFSYSVSHDLRGPLRSMDGFSMVLLEDYGDKLDEEGQDALNRIRAASQRMGELIDDLLRLSHVTRAELRLTVVDLTAMAKDLATVLHRDQPARTVRFDIEDGLSLTADAPLMRIAMQNLLQNAWKFTSGKQQAVIRVGAAARDGGTTFFVADNGDGFDMAHAGKLFGAFQRLHHATEFPGTGIGLAIVHRILRRHGGSVWAEAEKGKGATIFFSVKGISHGPGSQDHLAG